MQLKLKRNGKALATTVIASGLTASFLSWSTSAHANGAPKRFAAAPQNLPLRVARGAKVALPLPGVTQAIVEDQDIARVTYQDGHAFLEGVGEGDTTVEIYQGTETPRLLSVTVHDIADTRLSAAPASSGSSGDALLATPVTTPALAPVSPVTDLEPLPVAITPAKSALSVALTVAPAPGNPAQAVFTLTYGNAGGAPAQDVIVRFALDEKVSYVTGSGSNGAHYDAAERSVVWNLGRLGAGVISQKLQLRVEPIERQPTTFDSVATIEDDSHSVISSSSIRYSTATTPLLTVFALPDRFLAGKSAPVLVDVKGSEFQSAVDRLQSMGIVTGKQPGLFYPAAPTQRAEYAIMTLNGLNLRDLRDLTQIKFVLGRKSIVNLSIFDSNGKSVASLIRNTQFDPGEHTAIWSGRVGTGYAAPGRYVYRCEATDQTRKETTTLKGQITIVPQTPLIPQGTPSFVDVKPTDWYAGYLAVGEKQGLVVGYGDKTFKPTNSISRVEATAIVVRALGLEDLARQRANDDVGFLDYQNIEPWARGYVSVATTVAKTAAGKTMIRGLPTNFFEPQRDLRRDEAAVIVQRLIDRETNRSISISGAMVPGTTVTINSRTVQADDQGNFKFSIEANTSQATTVAVLDTRSNGE